MSILYRQDWIWRTRGWDSEDDGYSLHVYLSDVHAFVSAYWDKMPDDVPEEYSCPTGSPRQISESDVDPVILEAVKKSRHGVKV